MTNSLPPATRPSASACQRASVTPSIITPIFMFPRSYRGMRAFGQARILGSARGVAFCPIVALPKSRAVVAQETCLASRDRHSSPKRVLESRRQGPVPVPGGRSPPVEPAGFHRRRRRVEKPLLPLRPGDGQAEAQDVGGDQA